MFNLNNKVAIITGGCGSIGKAYTKALLENNVKGIGILDIDEETGKVLDTEYSKHDGHKRVTFVKCDVSNMDSMKKAFQTVVETYNQLDIIINNAGIIDEFNISRVFSINFNGVVHGTTLAIEFLNKFKSDDAGILINTSSIAGLMPFPYLDIYSATKAAVLSYGRSLASAEFYEKHKIKVINLCPGGTESNLISTENLKNAMNDDLIVEFTNMLKVTPFQSPEILAIKVIEIIKKANHGDIWVVNNGEEELIKIPMLFKL